MQIKDLKPNKRNPRKITDKKLKSLPMSLEKFGDLSGFVYNRRTKQLVSGHQKQKVIPPTSSIKIEKKYDVPTKCFTVAEGYVDVFGEKFKYREVDAPQEWEVEAMIAANKQGGDWDTDLLKITLTDFPKIDLDLVGFEEIELKQMKIDLPVQSIDLRTHEEEESDEEYVRNTPQTTEQIPTGNGVPSSNTIADIEENKPSAISKRWVIIIDCKSEESKQGLKEKLRPLVEEANALFF